jgi:hypothetical protein
MHFASRWLVESGAIAGDSEADIWLEVSQIQVCQAKEIGTSVASYLPLRVQSHEPAQYFIAKTVNGREYVVLLDSTIVAGPFASAAEAVKAREALLKAERDVVAD